jgi:hypothetical protein
MWAGTEGRKEFAFSPSCFFLTLFCYSYAMMLAIIKRPPLFEIVHIQHGGLHYILWQGKVSCTYLNQRQTLLMGFLDWQGIFFHMRQQQGNLVRGIQSEALVHR